MANPRIKDKLPIFVDYVGNMASKQENHTFKIFMVQVGILLPKEVTVIW
jgi:hypothetical protein